MLSARTGLRRAAGLSMIGAVVAGLLPLAAPVASAATYRTPATPRFTEPAERTVPYEPQTTCDPREKAGVVAFKNLILATYPNTGSYGIVRACSDGGGSEHKEGRAWDWKVSATNSREAGQAKAMLSWLTGKDAEMARRLGVMYVVWNDRIFSTYRRSEGWRPYRSTACRSIPLSKCSTTLRHRNHVHLSFSRAGAAKRTSFWSSSTASRRTSRPSGSLSAYKGKVLRPGSRGSAVTALQKSLRMTQITGYYGRITRAKVLAFKKPRGLGGNDTVGRVTWTKLEANLAYHSRRIARVDHVFLRPGARHPRAVPVLERALRLRRADGYYDSSAVAAMQVFQKHHGISPTGVVTPLTWLRLRGL